MMAKNNTRNLSKIILMSSLITGLSACNHNDDDKLLARDSTPIDFSLTAEQVSNLNPGQSIYSGVVNIYGVDVGTRTQVRITGGEYSVITEPGTFNVADLTFTSEPSTALLGNRVVVKATSSEQFEDSHAVILEVGGVSSEMLLTTRPRDESPDAFTIAGNLQMSGTSFVGDGSLTFTGNLTTDIFDFQGANTVFGGLFASIVGCDLRGIRG